MENILKSSDMRVNANENKINTVESRVANMEVNVDFIENTIKRIGDKGGSATSLGLGGDLGDSHGKLPPNRKVSTNIAISGLRRMSIAVHSHRSIKVDTEDTVSHRSGKSNSGSPKVTISPKNKMGRPSIRVVSPKQDAKRINAM